MGHTEISTGLHILIKDSRIHAEIRLQKLHAMQEIYFKRNPDLYMTASRKINQQNGQNLVNAVSTIVN